MIQDFGLVARGAQLMVTELLRLTYTPRPFQYGVHGGAGTCTDAVIKIMNLTEEGYCHVAELDIKNQ